jgi:hypothetical protein
MHLSNYYYGHSHVLAKYCGIKTKKKIYGVVQHGVDDGTAFPSRAFFRRVPFFVWNAPLANLYHQRGWRKPIIIGSPILYLEDVHFLQKEKKSLVRDLVWVAFAPHHTIHGEGRKHLSAFLRELQDINFPRDHKVYLHRNEYEDYECRRMVEQYNFVPTTIWDSEDLFWDESFISRLIGEFNLFDVALFSQAGTAFWYAAYVGVDARVLNAAEGQQIEMNLSKVLDQEFRSHIFWPSQDFDLKRIRDSAITELGVNYKMTTEDMSSVLGYQSLVNQFFAQLLALASRGRRTIRSIFRRS